MKTQKPSARRVVSRTLLGLSAIALTCPLVAQEDDAPALEEIIVTANKRAESVQDVAQTVNVVSGDFLDNRQIRSFKEIATTVAGLSLTRVSGGEQSASMRGIKMSNPGGAGSATNTVEMYLNEVPISAVDSFNALFDIGQVEVLRGPQGTLRGRPSPSGAITIAARKGSLTSSDGYVEGSLSDNGGKNLKAAWGGPLSDTVAFRLAGQYDESDDNAIKSLATGKTSYHENTGLRGVLSWDPSERLSVELMHQYLDQEQDFYRGIQGTGILPESIGFNQTYTYEDRVALNQPNPNSYEQNLTTLTLRYDFGDYALHYVGGYNDSSFRYVLDFDFAGVGPVQALQNLDIKNDTSTTTNEVRFESTNGEFYNFTVGVFTSSSDVDSYFAVNPFFQNPNNPFSRNDTGYFMNHRFDITENDRFSFGVRRSKFEVDRSTGVDVEYSATTGNVSFQHDFADDIMAYVTWGKSFRPGTGGANAAANPGVPASFANSDAEKSTSLEIGLKTQWLDDRVKLNIAYFDQNYDGFIAVTNNVTCTATPNPDGLAFATLGGTNDPADPDCRQNVNFNGDAVSEGVEVEFSALITDNWSLGINYTYTNAHFDNALVPCNDYNGDGVIDTEGTPRVQQGQYISQCRTNAALGQLGPHSYSFNTSYDFNVGGMAAYIRANGIYTEESIFPQTNQILPADTRVNAYVGLKGRENTWEVSVWAKNLFDKVVQDNDGGPWAVNGVVSGFNIGTATLGREVGLTIRREFF